MPDPEQNKQAVHRLNTMWEGDLDIVDELFEESFVNHDPMRPGTPPGPEGVKQTVAALQRGFPDITFDVEDPVAEGDKVAFRTVGRGTHEGTFAGVEPTGREIELSAIVMLRFADGKVVERWAKFDTMGMLQQMGVLPEPEPMRG